MHLEPAISNSPALVGSDQLVMKDASIKQVPWSANIRATRMCCEKVGSCSGSVSLNFHKRKTEHVLPFMKAAAHEPRTLCGSAHNFGKLPIGALLPESRSGLGVVKDRIGCKNPAPVLHRSALFALMIVLPCRIARQNILNLEAIKYILNFAF